MTALLQRNLAEHRGQTTARIQEAHIFIGHALCGLIEEHLGLV